MIGTFRSSYYSTVPVTVPQRPAVVSFSSCCVFWSWASMLQEFQSLLMLFEWSLMWVASLTLCVYQWGSRSINLTSFPMWPVSWAHSETAEVWVQASRISLSYYLIFSCMGVTVCHKRFRASSRPYRLKKTRSKQLELRDVHPKVTTSWDKEQYTSLLQLPDK